MIFVGSGSNNPGPVSAANPSSSSNSVKVFSAFTGALVPGGLPNGDFFVAGTGGITNGIDDVAFDTAGNFYVTALSDNKVVKFDSTGNLVNDNFASGNGLTRPTGLTFGPDGNLYVSSSLSDQILTYDGGTGAFISAFVTDSNGAIFGLDTPRGLIFGPDGNLYVASRNERGGLPNSGIRVLRFYGPNTPPGPPDAGDGFPSPANAGTAATFAFGTNAPSFLAFNPSATDPTILNPPAATPTPVPPPPAIPERAGNPAQLESNRISSPGAFTASRLPATDASGAALGQDVVEDVEPGFSRSTTSSQNVAQLAFSSQRRTAAIPGSRPNPDGSIDTRPIVSNPSGGVGGTHDIWVTASQDFTAPILVQVSSGNSRYPVLAPGPQAPANLPSPRTAEAGLTPGTPVRIAFVVDERESGLNAVALRFYDASNRPNIFNSTANFRF